MSKKNNNQEAEEIGDYPEIDSTNIQPVESAEECQFISQETKTKEEARQMEKEPEKMPCAECGKEMELIAKGKKGRRFWGCNHCSGNPKEPKLYYQPSDINALRPLDQKPLIDMGFKN